MSYTCLRVPLIIAFELRVEDFFGWHWSIFRVFRDAVQTEKYSLSGKIELLEVPLNHHIVYSTKGRDAWQRLLNPADGLI